MKQAKRVTKALQTLNIIVDYLEFYIGDREEYRTEIRKNIADIEKLLKQLSVEQRVQNIKVAHKIEAKYKEKHEKEEN